MAPGKRPRGGRSCSDRAVRAGFRLDHGTADDEPRAGSRCRRATDSIASEFAVDPSVANRAECGLRGPAIEALLDPADTSTAGDQDSRRCHVARGEHLRVGARSRFDRSGARNRICAAGSRLLASGRGRSRRGGSGGCRRGARGSHGRASGGGRRQRGPVLATDYPLDRQSIGSAKGSTSRPTARCSAAGSTFSP